MDDGHTPPRRPAAACRMVRDHARRHALTEAHSLAQLPPPRATGPPRTFRWSKCTLHTSGRGGHGKSIFQSGVCVPTAHPTALPAGAKWWVHDLYTGLLLWSLSGVSPTFGVEPVRRASCVDVGGDSRGEGQEWGAGSSRAPRVRVDADAAPQRAAAMMHWPPKATGAHHHHSAAQRDLLGGGGGAAHAPRVRTTGAAAPPLAFPPSRCFWLPWRHRRCRWADPARAGGPQRAPAL